MTHEFATQVMKCSATKPRNDANYKKNCIAGRYGAEMRIVNDYPLLPLLHVGETADRER